MKISNMSKRRYDEYKPFLRTLANGTRLAIIKCLQAGEKPVSRIVKELRAPQPTVSYNLGILAECSFVSAKKVGKERIYALNTKTIKPLLKLVDIHVHCYCKPKCLCGC